MSTYDLYVYKLLKKSQLKHMYYHLYIYIYVCVEDCVCNILYVCIIFYVNFRFLTPIAGTYIFCCQCFIIRFYLDNYAKAGQVGMDGKLEGGKKGGLFYDVQNLSRIWNHPYILHLSKLRKMDKVSEGDIWINSHF